MIARWILLLALALLLAFLLTGGITRWLGRLDMAQRREAQTVAERRWPFLAIEDFTEDGELAPSRPRAHTECFDNWVDGKRPCARCKQIFEVKA
jgi:hypothetical protein